MPSLSPRGRVSFPSVWEPSGPEGSKPKFNITLVFRPSEMDDEQKEKFQQLLDSAEAACKQRFGCSLGGSPEGSVKTVASPFHKGEEKPKFYEPGDVYVKFISEQAPKVVDQSRTPISPSSGDFYPGCWAHVTYEVFAYDKSGNKGVSFGLRNVQKTADDEPFGGGRSSVEEDFEVLATPDEIPF